MTASGRTRREPQLRDKFSSWSLVKPPPPRSEGSGRTRVPVTVDQSEGQFLVRLEGEVTITGAAELKTLLLEGLASGKELRVNLEQATDLDITALQLLCATERETRGSASKFLLSGSLPEELSAAVIDAGFERFPVPTEETP
jgi:anti-anti-sigma regulatory factor